MIEEEEALARILAQLIPLPSRTVPLIDALESFATAEISARLALPSFDNSAMDGYAVAAESCAIGGRVRIAGEQPAGLNRGLNLTRGEAIRILTGAPVPKGADAIIMQEDVTVEGNEIVLNAEVVAGEFIRRRGGDVAEGQRIVRAGDRITPQTLGLLAAQGIASVQVCRPVRAAIITTGDELAQPGATLQPGQIYESNGPLLQALLRQRGVEVMSVVHCADRAEEIEAAIRGGAAGDVMIICGGVSVGTRDFVKPALLATGATLDLWRVAVKPGKPFLFGRTGSCAIFGLPGNPVSAFVTFLLFVRPALLRLMGATDSALPLPRFRARLAEAVHNPGERRHYMRGLLRDGIFTPIGRQESHALFGLSRSNSLLRLEPGQQLSAGAETDVLAW